jgi:SAM-dependent methyltransferase
LSREDDACRLCGAPAPQVFHEVEGVPVHCCQLIPTRDEAVRAPVGRMRLAFCARCGFIQNGAFDPEAIDYTRSYEDSQDFSPRFRAFAQNLVERLVDRYGLHGKDILEIGCGQGEFLLRLCEAGGNRGVGIDPAYQPERRGGAKPASIRFIRDFYSERYRELPADLVCCRHTLEHLPSARQFVELIRESLRDGRDSAVFFEVPDVARVLDELAFWDLYYEHCSYFSLGSLARLLRSCDFDVLHLAKVFDGQYLSIEARASGGAPAERFPEEEDRESLARSVQRFTKEVPAMLDRWRERLAGPTKEGERAVLWGAGSKAVGFLTTLGIVDEIEYVVDINPNKQGMFLAGTGQQIIAPEFLRDYQADLVIVMNPIYVDEIRAQTGEMGSNPEMVAL